MTHYHDTTDAQYTAVYKKETPGTLEAFNAFNAAVFAPDGADLSVKVRELIAVAVAIITKCVYCIDGHSKNAVRAGATQKELAEAAWVAAAIDAGGAYAHGRLAFKSTAERD